MDKPHIYLVDDNEDLQAIISENLIEEGYHVTQIYSASDLLHRLKASAPKGPDIILLDLILPDANGLNIIQNIHDYSDAPIIVISGKNKLVDKVIGLEIGADDYLAKPFEMRELLARIRAHLRRHKNLRGRENLPPGELPRFGSWMLDAPRMQLVDENGVNAGLTVREYRLFAVLASAPDRVWTRNQLLEKSRDNDTDVFDRTIDIQITRIRKKINDSDGSLIRTIRGAGYMLVSNKDKGA
jgi:two-component system OmpR family response regulator